MGPGQILEECGDLIQSFDPKVMTVDAHALEQLGDTSLPDAASHKVFMQQVLYGCVRYRKPLRVFLLNFYHDNGGKILRSDYTLFQILAYLAVFRLRELGFDEFQRFVHSQEPGKMAIFMEYLWSPENLNGPIKAEWLTILDREYIEGTLVATLDEHRAQVEGLCQELGAKAFGLEAARKEKEKGPQGLPTASRKKRTVPRSPRLTKPKPRPVPEPIEIKQEVQARPVEDVKRYLEQSKTVAQIEKAGRERRRRQRERTAAQYKAGDEFNFHAAESNLERVRAEVEAQREAELQFDSFRAKPAPVFPDQAPGTEVKLNVASVLREDALYKDKQRHEARMIEEYESGLRDANEFYRWQTEMREKDQEAKMAEVARRREESVRSAKDALEAQRRHREENHDLAGKIKDAAKAMDEQRAAEQELALMTNKQLVSEVKAVEKVAPRLAEKRVHHERQRARKAVQADIQERVARKEQQMKKEQAERADRVRQIRALEKVLHKAETGAEKFDPTTTMHQGMLEEMSLVELKERLALAKARTAEAEQDKRKQILLSKKEKADDVQTRIANIRRVRAAAAASNKDARQRRLRAEADKAEARRLERNAGNEALADKLAARREAQRVEAQALVDEQVRVANQQMFLGAAKSMMEEKHFDQQCLGAERELREKQTRAKQTQKVYEDTMAHAKAVQKQLRREAAVEKKRFLAAQDKALREAQHELSGKKHLEQEAKKSARRAAHVRHKALVKVMDTAKPYAAMQARKSLERGRAHARRKELEVAAATARSAQLGGGYASTGMESFGSTAQSEMQGGEGGASFTFAEGGSMASGMGMVQQ